MDSAIITALFTLICGLAIWSVSYTIVETDGPLDIFKIIRERFGIIEDRFGDKYSEQFIGKILSCVYCCAHYVGLLYILAQLAHNQFELMTIAYYFAMMGVVLYLERR